jgi:hypothetical protein
MYLLPKQDAERGPLATSYKVKSNSALTPLTDTGLFSTLSIM